MPPTSTVNNKKERNKSTMAKTENTNSNATPTAGKTKKAAAAPGSSIPAQAKQLVVSMVTEMREHLASLKLTFEDVLTSDTAAWAIRVADEIAKTAQRGLPLATQLENVQKEIAQHWEMLRSGTGPASREWEAESERLLKKRTSIEKQIEAKKQAEKQADSATASDQGGSQAASATAANKGTSAQSNK